jgi:hypothetical protein
MPTFEAQRSAAEKIEDAQIKESVIRGIERLNKVFGPDWVDEVDPRSLLMSNCSSCVLGQVYGDYYIGLEKLGIDLEDDDEERDDETEDGIFFGFDAIDGEYKELDEAWRMVVLESHHV